MKEIKLNYQSGNVDILIENNLFSNLSRYIDLEKKYIILIDELVYSLYKDKLPFKNSIIKILPVGEETKNIETIIQIVEFFLEHDINKGDTLINIGGGVICDIGGFVASIYKRGITYYNIPTTLLAQVDAAIGGKTGIDFNFKSMNFKNQIGTIYQPKYVFVDPLFLKTLIKLEYLSGFGEVVKYGLCFNKDLFYSLFKEYNIEEVIYECIKIKSSITEKDEFEKRERLALNYGHTIGHALEAVSNYTIPHGICILYGMFYETEANDIKKELENLMSIYNINIDFSINKEELKMYILQDKKIENEYIKIPVLKEIGRVEIEKIKIDDYLKRLK